MACTEMFPDREQLPCTTFEDALEAVSSGRAGLAMIPVDNSIAGRVADIHHLLPESGLHIVGEHFLPIHFQLLGSRVRRSTRSGPSAATCTRSASAARSSASTAGPRWSPTTPPAPPARWPSWPTRPSRRCRPAAPPSCTASRRWPPTSRTSTTTRPGSWCCPGSREVPPVGSGPIITSFVYRVRNVSAALYKALGGFATNGVNMTKLESTSSAACSSRPSSTPTSKATRRTERGPRAGGARVLLGRGPDPRRLPGPPLPRRRSPNPPRTAPSARTTRACLRPLRRREQVLGAAARRAGAKVSTWSIVAFAPVGEMPCRVPRSRRGVRRHFSLLGSFPRARRLLVRLGVRDGCRSRRSGGRRQSGQWVTRPAAERTRLAAAADR